MGSIRQAIIIVAKQPAGDANPLSADDQASLDAALLCDTVRLAQAAACADVVIALSPRVSSAWVEEKFPGLPRITQRGDDPGDRLAALTSDAWKLRYRPCVFIASDCPDLPLERITTAFDSLQPGSDTDVVICPSYDGGYCLLGIGGPYGSLFRHIAWSGDRVLRDTLTRAEESELHVELLDPWHDNGGAADLDRLRKRLQCMPDDVAPTTQAWLDLHCPKK